MGQSPCLLWESGNRARSENQSVLLEVMSPDNVDAVNVLRLRVSLRCSHFVDGCTQGRCARARSNISSSLRMNFLSSRSRARAEADVRTDLGGPCRLDALAGWDDTIYSHLAAAVPGEPAVYLINEFGLGFDEVCASGPL